jgi:hypothetical protein
MFGKMNIFRIIVRWATVAYAISLLAACGLEVFPREVREHAGKRYEIRRGFGFPWVFIPGLSLCAAGDEPCRLVIIDKRTGQKEVIGHDIPIDIYEEHPEVWPDKIPTRR